MVIVPESGRIADTLSSSRFPMCSQKTAESEQVMMKPEGLTMKMCWFVLAPMVLSVMRSSSERRSPSAA